MTPPLPENTERPRQPFVDEIHSNTVQEFIARLDEYAVDDSNPTETRWIFRGQANSNWVILPAAWRRAAAETYPMLVPRLESYLPSILDSVTSYLALTSSMRPNTNNHNPADLGELLLCTACEIVAVETFVGRCDAAGLFVSPSFEIPTLASFRSNPTRIFMYIHSEMISRASALARHHNIPTRLIDFTFDPMVAAYFAAGGSSSGRSPESDNFAVIAICESVIPATRMQMYRVPRHGFEYLQAQRGLFVYPPDPAQHYLNNSAWPSLESLYEHAYNDSTSPLPERIKKFTCPSSYAPELLAELKKRRISTPYLTPSYERVADSLKTERLFS